MASTVIELRKDQCRAAGDVVARVFADGVVFSAMFPNRNRRHKLLPSGCRGSLVHGLLSGQIAEATATLSAVSLWSPPDYRDSLTSWIRSLPFLTGFLGRLTPGDARRFLHWSKAWEKRRHQLLPEPHWHLEMLCVDTPWQGSGLGAVLALHGLERAAAEGRPAFLETDSPENVRFYEKMGFGVVEALDDDLLHIPIWRMVWRPENAIVPSHGRRRNAVVDAPR
jgi:GNAT superfamily N-acetyltransferase